MHALYMRFHTLNSRMAPALHEKLLQLQSTGRIAGAFGRRVMLLGLPGAGKSYVVRCCTTLIRMTTMKRKSAVVGAPSGIAGFVGGGCTWHSLLHIPTGPRFTRSFEGQGGSRDLQDELDELFGVIGDELSLTGRTLLGWAAHKLRTNVAQGRGSDEVDAGEHLAFWLLCGDVRPPALTRNPAPPPCACTCVCD